MNSAFSHEFRRQRVSFGCGDARLNLKLEVERHDASRVLLIVTRSAQRVASALSEEIPVVARIDGVTQHVPLEEAIAARDIAAQVDADVIVCIGGGSAVGLAKSVAVVDGQPIIAIPTTYAGSEATNIWAVSSDGVKTVQADDRVLPASVIYDAAMVSSLPVEMGVLSGLNAVAHCVDTMWATGASPISQLLALEGVGSLTRGIRKLTNGVEADAQAFQDCQYGGYLAAISYASVGKALHHEIVHVLGGFAKLPHARTHAVILPYVVALNAPRVPAIARRMATAVCRDAGMADTEVVPALITELLALRSGIPGPWTLSGLGLDAGDIASVAQHVLDVVPDTNPAPVSVEIVTRLLQSAHVGTDPLELLD